MGQPYDPAGRSSSNRRYKTKEEKADDDLKQLLGTSDVSDTETLRRSMHWRRKRESESAEAAFRGGGLQCCIALLYSKGMRYASEKTYLHSKGMGRWETGRGGGPPSYRCGRDMVHVYSVLLG